MNIRAARPDEVGVVTNLINAAFVVERFFKQGDRTTIDHVRKILEVGTFLVAEGRGVEAGPLTGAGLVGSVYAEIRGGRVYIGMLSVEPSLQGRGIGRALMSAAEDHGRRHACAAADVTVVNLRTELPPFYRKLGYVETGTEPFDREGGATRECHFIRMSKPL